MKFIDETPDKRNLLERIEMMLSKAKSYVYILSPYLQISERIKELLIDKNKAYPEKEIDIVCRIEDLHDDEYDKLQDIIKQSNNIIRLHFNPFIHAKILVNEEYALVSSMNLYEASEQNYEAGIYFSRAYRSEVDAYNSLKDFCNEILKNEYTTDYDEELQLSGYIKLKKHSLTEKNYTWLKEKSEELKKKSWYELQNDIINQAKVSFYEPTSVMLNNTEILCKHGLAEKIKELYQENKELRKRLKKYEPLN